VKTKGGGTESIEKSPDLRGKTASYIKSHKKKPGQKKSSRRGRTKGTELQKSINTKGGNGEGPVYGERKKKLGRIAMVTGRKGVENNRVRVRKRRT